MKMVVHLHTVHQTPFERREKKTKTYLIILLYQLLDYLKQC